MGYWCFGYGFYRWYGLVEIDTTAVTPAQVITSMDRYKGILPENSRNLYTEAVHWRTEDDYVQPGATSDLSKNGHFFT